MAEHKHGEMDTSTQEATFNGFMKLVTRSSIVIIVALVLLSLLNA
ncbi:aa3-type cytochrome c oxidase subunit IV [Pseudoroseicyclus sp. CXY001]